MAGIVVAWAAFLALSLLAAGDGVLSGDAGFARWVQGADGTSADRVASFGNWIGAYWVGVAITLPVVGVLGWRRRWREVGLLAAVLLVRTLNATVKGWIDSPRPTPDLVRVSEEAHGLGFPSGHASGAFLLFGALAWIVWSTAPAGVGRTVLSLTCLSLILIVGFGRVYTGAHWPSDVLGGFLFGAAILATLVVGWSVALTHHRRSGREGGGAFRAARR